MSLKLITSPRSLQFIPLSLGREAGREESGSADITSYSCSLNPFTAFIALLLPLLAIGCGGPEPDPKARQAAEWALRRGGTIRVADVPGVIRDLGRLPSGGIALEEINMNSLGIDQEPVRDDELLVLEGLTNLRVLGLYGSTVSDKGAETIATLKSLRELELSQSRITDKGLEELAKLPNLEKLFIRNIGDSVTDDAVASFKKRTGAEVFR